MYRIILILCCIRLHCEWPLFIGPYVLIKYIGMSDHYHSHMAAYVHSNAVRCISMAVV